MKIFKSFAILFAFSAIFTSCMSSPKIPGSKISPVYVTNSKKYYLISPQNLDSVIDSQVLLEGEFGENSFNFLSYVQADKEQISLSIFTDFGNLLGELIFDGYSVVLDSSIFPKNLKPEYIVADLQFAFYNFDAVKSSLKKINLDFQKTDENTRVIKDGSKIIEKITKEQNVTTIQNFLRGYKYILTEATE